MLLAIMLVFAFTPIGFIQVGSLAATLMNIPVLIAACVIGIGAGVVLGASFGVISLVRAFVTPTVTSFIFMNPLVAILPRVVVPIVAFAVAWAFSRSNTTEANTQNTNENTNERAIKHANKQYLKKQYFTYTIASLLGSLTNTVLVLGSIWVFYAAPYAEATGLETIEVGAALLLVALTNGLPEAILAAIAVPPVCAALRRTNFVR